MYDRAEQEYFSKVGVQGELEYKEPLEKRYGDKYFEYILRDRYKDEDKKSRQFLYQLRKSDTGKHNSRGMLELAQKEGYRLPQREYLELVGKSHKN